MATVRDATYDLLRALDMTTVFGNPGSTEEPFLTNFPADFTYVLALQEASAVAMADGYAQVTGRPAHVNLHAAPGTGNGLGALVTAWHNKAPLIVSAGQQTRMMTLIEPRLTSLGPTMLPQPYVKWSHEPARAQDVPAALMRAYATARQPPAGPVYLSIPLDDWEKPADGPPAVRRTSTRVAPDPVVLRRFAETLAAGREPALVIGPGVDRNGAWAAALSLAEKLRVPVWSPPFPERFGFPHDHPQFQGVLPTAIGPLAERLSPYDVVLVIGAPVFRYYPYLPGEHGHLPDGVVLLHLTDDPDEALRAPVGESLIGDLKLACTALGDLVAAAPATRPMPTARPAPEAPPPETPLSPRALFTALAGAWPQDAILVSETPSNVKVLHRQLLINRPASYFASASGGLGYGLPAAVGIALGERHTGRHRPVVAVIGDGAFQYSPQALWTAAQHRLPVVFVVPVNEQYAILKSFAEFSRTPNVPALDLPGLDIPSIARGFGAAGHWVESADALAEALRVGQRAAGPTVLAVPITRDVPPLL